MCAIVRNIENVRERTYVYVSDHRTLSGFRVFDWFVFYYVRFIKRLSNFRIPGV